MHVKETLWKTMILINSIDYISFIEGPGTTGRERLDVGCLLKAGLSLYKGKPL